MTHQYILCLFYTVAFDMRLFRLWTRDSVMLPTRSCELRSTSNRHSRCQAEFGSGPNVTKPAEWLRLSCEKGQRDPRKFRVAGQANPDCLYGDHLPPRIGNSGIYRLGASHL